MLITCSLSSSFWTFFLTGGENNLMENWLYLKILFYTVGKESNNWKVLNYCLIVAKYHVLTTSVRDGILDFDSFLLRFHNKIDILRTIAFKPNRLEHLKIHGPILMLVQLPYYIFLFKLYCTFFQLIFFFLDMYRNYYFSFVFFFQCITKHCIHYL